MPRASAGRPAACTRGDDWTRLAVSGNAGEADELAERLRSLGASSVEFAPAAESEAVFADGSPEPLVWKPFETAALFAERTAAEEAARALETEWPGCTVSVKAVPERDWLGAVRDGFRPRRFGQRLWVVPAWAPPPDPAAANVLIEPGLAFGTGMHPSTALCLEWLAQAALDGSCVLDYGTGSGILAIAAACLGASRVVAVDNDAQALESARSNARLNGFDIEVAGPDALGATTADLVLANILAVPLIALAPELVSRTLPGGTLVLAGVTDDQADVVAAAYAGHARVTEHAGSAGWVRLVLRRDRKA